MPFKITANTPDKIRIIPVIIFNVRGSLKNMTPKNTAVKGSSAPKIAVLTGPVRRIAIVIVSREIMVGIIDNKIA